MLHSISTITTNRIQHQPHVHEGYLSSWIRSWSIRRNGVLVLWKIQNTFSKRSRKLTNLNYHRNPSMWQWMVGHSIPIIDHEEGAQACYEKHEQRKNKRIPSITLKSLILLRHSILDPRFTTKLWEHAWELQWHQTTPIFSWLNLKIT